MPVAIVRGLETQLTVSVDRVQRFERTSDSIRGIERLERFERNKLPLHPSRLQLTLGRCPQCVTPGRHAALHTFGG